jgi:hypothetical protein
MPEGELNPCRHRLGMSAFARIVLQKSKVASVRISGETLKGEAINDSYNLSGATEVAYEFSERRRGPSDLYTKTAPTALGISDTFCKTTFATLSRAERTQLGHHAMSQKCQGTKPLAR